MGKYIKFEDVRVRLVGKVRFTTDPENEDRMSETLANRLIAEAESHVELDLSPRYSAPFQTKDGSAFANLPENPTRNYIRTLCELMACVRILEEDFGSGTAVDGEKYAEKLRKRYGIMMEKLIERKKDGGVEALGYKYPPLPELRLNYMNEVADDGFMGSVLVTSQGDGDYPRAQINDPSENFWNGIPDELD